MGNPVIVQYGPLPEHCAIYIPKYHPYAPYHIATLSNEIIDTDAYIRYIIEIANKIVSVIGPIPTGAGRRPFLVKLRTIILQESAKLDFLVNLQREKTNLVKQNQGFIGEKSKAVWVKSTISAADRAKSGLTAQMV